MIASLKKQGHGGILGGLQLKGCRTGVYLDAGVGLAGAVGLCC